MTITNVKTLQERLTFAREMRELKQHELAKKAKCSQSAIGNVESGLRKSLKNIVLVARALNVSVDWLYDGKGPEPVVSDTLVRLTYDKSSYKKNADFASTLIPAGEVVNLPTVQRPDQRTLEVIELMSKLNEAQKTAALARLREFVNYLDPPQDGQALSVAVK